MSLAQLSVAAVLNFGRSRWLASARRSKPAADAGFTVLELLVTLFIIGALVAIFVPIYLNTRAAQFSNSVEDSVHSTQAYVSQDVLLNYRTGEFDERTLPKRDIVATDGTTILVTGPGGSGPGTADNYEIRGYNPASSKYKDPANAYVFISKTAKFGPLADFKPRG